MKEIKFKDLKQLCFCNSDKLFNKVFLIDGVPHEWVGIGMVECKPDPLKTVKVVY